MRGYEVIGWTKFAEEDVYSEGCLPDSGEGVSGNDRFVADTPENLIEKLMRFVSQEDKYNVLLNSCGEDGRVDIQIYETADGTPAYEQDIKMWKEGHRKLWLACYTFHVEVVQRETEPLDIPGYPNDN